MEYVSKLTCEENASLSTGIKFTSNDTSDVVITSHFTVMTQRTLPIEALTSVEENEKE
jgi:hypothetical protein